MISSIVDYKIKCLAVDDEAYAVDIIAHYIEKTPFLQLVAKTTNPFEALELVKLGKVDLVFLDIQMRDLSGIQFLNICGTNVKVILTTAYPQYAIEGFELNVLDYLLKPISFERFYKAADKARLLLDLEIQAKHIGKPENNFLFVKGSAKNELIKVKYSSIRYLEGLKNYISIYTETERLITYHSLRDMELLLPKSQFLRIHKSYIIAVQHIEKIDGNKVCIGDEWLPISETYKKVLLKEISKE